MTEHVNAGNAAFVDGDYEASLQHYSAAIAAGGSADAYSKRAAAQLQLACYAEAAADATASLKLQPSKEKRSSVAWQLSAANARGAS